MAKAPRDAGKGGEGQAGYWCVYSPDNKAWPSVQQTLPGPVWLSRVAGGWAAGTRWEPGVEARGPWLWTPDSVDSSTSASWPHSQPCSSHFPPSCPPSCPQAPSRAARHPGRALLCRLLCGPCSGLSVTLRHSARMLLGGTIAVTAVRCRLLDQQRP